MHKHVKVAAAVLTILAVFGLVYAGYWIWSQLVKVTYTPPQYALTLQAEQTGDYTITLTATLTVKHYGQPSPVPVSGATIHFYLTDQTGTEKQELGTKETNLEGVAIFVWDVPSPTSPDPVDYYFIAGYEVP